MSEENPGRPPETPAEEIRARANRWQDFVADLALAIAQEREAWAALLPQEEGRLPLSPDKGPVDRCLDRMPMSGPYHLRPH